MNIIKKPIKWNGSLIPLKPNQIDGIALHHMAHPTWAFEQVHEYHRDSKKWVGIGYNYWIGFDGSIYEGRGKNQGAHVLKHNPRLLGIGFQGDYEAHNKTMPDAQFNTAIELIQWLQKEFPLARVVHGHSHWQSTQCPGRYFPLMEMVSLKKRGDIQEPKEIKDVLNLDKPWMWDMLQEAIPKLSLDDPDMWLEKAKNKTLTVSELTWLNTIILSRK